MEENQHELEAFRDHWKNKGAEVKVRPKLEWTSSGSIKASNIDHQTKFRIACPWGNNTMAIHQDGSVVACAVDYEGRHKVGNAGEKTVKELWKKLGETLRTHHRNHDWSKIPEVCKNCGDWQTAGAEYEEKDVPDGARPFWFDKETTNYKMNIE
jgi:radical SAM protein with 4Fe4S-binding SPASM domain